MKKFLCMLTACGLALALLAGCGTESGGTSQPDSAPVSSPDTAAASSSEETPSASSETLVSSSEPEAPAECPLADGVYTAAFKTDSSMFRTSEAMDGRGTLTVENGVMTLHVSLMSKKILHLFPGTAEDAQKDGAVWLEPTTDMVTYSDGLSEEVYGFDIPVPAIDSEFDLALIGTKGKWYDHKVSVEDPKPQGNDSASPLGDGEYLCEVTLSGGTGRVAVKSPTPLRVEDGKYYAVIEWDSPNYDYMKVNGERYDPIPGAEGCSVFEIPVSALDMPVDVIADTVAMSEPHEVAYTLVFSSRSAVPADKAE